MTEINADTQTGSLSSSPANVLRVTGNLDTAQPVTTLVLPDGHEVLVPTSMFAVQPTPQDRAGTTEPVAIPLIEERLDVTRRIVETGKVRLQKTVQTFETSLDEPLAVFTFDVERVVFNQQVDAAPPVRHEGDTTIYPLVEEQLVLTKHLVLKEEIRVTRRQTERRDTQTVTLRREHIDIERESLTEAQPEPSIAS